MTVLMLAIGIILAIAIVVSSFRVKATAVRVGAAVVAIAVMFLFTALASIQFIGDDEIGVVIKNFGDELPAGQIIAVNGEKGPQADILGPGWHFWYFPGLFTIEKQPVIQIRSDEVGLITATDGLPLPKGTAFAPEWSETDFQQMLTNAQHFLGEGGGYAGPQSSVLTPKTYRFNPRLFTVERVPVTNIEKGFVGVVKSNVGDAPEDAQGVDGISIVNRGQRGIWQQAYTPQRLYLNSKAYEITMVSTQEQNVRYGQGGSGDETEIEVRTSDGFTFPVDVRIEYRINPDDAATVVARFGGSEERMQRRLASAVRDIFRNNAENVKALDYVQQRSKQGETSANMLIERMAPLGITIKAVAIGNIGDEQSLGQLLKTQKDREIAVQEQITFQEQQKAAEQQKELSRTEQEAIEERRKATEEYNEQIAAIEARAQIERAKGEAESILIRAESQAEAFRVIAEQIGAGNAALIELLKIVGENGIDITPRVMVNGGGGGSSMDAETTALIGTMLDSMTSSAAEKSPGE